MKNRKIELLEDIEKLNLIKRDLIRCHDDFHIIFNKMELPEKSASADWKNNYMQIQKAIEELELLLKQDINLH